MKGKQHLEGQLDLLVFVNSEAGLEPTIRAEVTGLLRFLLDECIVPNATEAVDE